MKQNLYPDRCDRYWGRGWRCRRELHHEGPCPVEAVWWRKLLLKLQGRHYE